MSPYPEYPHYPTPPGEPKPVRELTAEENLAQMRALKQEPASWCRPCEKCGELEKRIMHLEIVIESLTGKPVSALEPCGCFMKDCPRCWPGRAQP